MLFGSACAPTTTTGGRPAWLSHCHVDGFDVETLCGTLTVPVQPGVDADTLDLRVVVVPAVKPVPDPDPLVLLAGGPGQAASEAYGAMMPSMARIQQSRDLVMMDQRGTGSSSPLDCPDLGEETLASRFSDEVPKEEVEQCRDALVLAGHDLSAFSTRNHSHDLEALRIALGADQWNLYGGSYGTRAALDYADIHPERVRRLILDGVAPRELPLFGTFGIDGQAALEAMLVACETDTEGCAAAFPHLRSRLQQLLAREATEVEVLHPRTGAVETLPLSGRVIAAIIRNILYSPQMLALLPMAVHQATETPPNLQPFVTLAGAVGGDTLEDTMSMGLMLSVACQEDVHRITGALTSASTHTFLGTQLIDLARDWCTSWPVDAQIPPPPPVAWPGPTLLLSGALDPVTPPRWAEVAARTLPDHHHLVAPGGGHIVFPYGCIPEQTLRFLDAPDESATTLVEPDCVDNIHRPPFVLDFAGPPG
ncbi:MAG: alpha/beta hydrolase [Deltaproteobacteria bacterium]|nr:alpha/beta hydrolase [Deltaproteobacteria bacterium]HCH65812.1 alpha/beta hydrolase [Deltaproteobacteria bacterium]